MWSEQQLEKQLEQRLSTLTEPDKSVLLTDYKDARRFVIDEIAGRIIGAEPDLTDHSENHLADVMRRAHDLMGETTEYFTPFELYLLCVSILFHDVGNVEGRGNHQNKIADIYNGCRHQASRFNAERTAILTIAGAHTGKARNGSKDTLHDVYSLPFRGQTVRGRELAAVLRLADELAEGPHRTSGYFLNNGKIAPTARIFHQYASASEYSVNQARIALTFTINMRQGTTGLEIEPGLTVEQFLSFCYDRVAKVDEERRYCKHYSDLLLRLKETGAFFTFWYGGHLVIIDIEPLSLSDLTVPGDNPRRIVHIYPSYEPTALVSKLEAECNGNNERTH